MGRRKAAPNPELEDWKAAIHEADRGMVTALPNAKPIAPCRPVDVSGLGRALQDLLPEAMPEDVVLNCEECEAAIWVAPKKRFLGSTGVARLVCYPCASELAWASREGIEGIRFHDISGEDHPEVVRAERPAAEAYPHRLFVPIDRGV